MENTTITTVVSEVGTPEGTKNEIRHGLTDSEIKDCRKVLNKGTEVMCRGMHPMKLYRNRPDSVFLRKSNHPFVKEAVDPLRDELYTFQTESWRTDLSTGKVKTIPNRGDDQIEMEMRVMQVMRWNGSLYDVNNKLVDLSKMPASSVRQFLRTNVFPRWQIDPRQRELPEFDPDSVNFELMEMLSAMSDLLDQKLNDFLVFHKWRLDNEGSGKVYAIGLGTTLGIKDAEAG